MTGTDQLSTAPRSFGTCPRVMPPPDRPAVVMDDGVVVTHGELEDRSRRLAALLIAEGLRPGDGLAIFAENHERYLEVCIAAERAGLYCTPINWHLGAGEAGYILADCGAKALVTTPTLGDTIRALEPELLAQLPVKLVLDGALDGFVAYDRALADGPLDHEGVDAVAGTFLLYSSGTTGNPKGIWRPLDRTVRYGQDRVMAAIMEELFAFGEDTVYLNPAPMYHAAPVGWSSGVLWLGGTVVMMRRFDPQLVLDLIERHRVTHAQFVPTHLSRMLQLPEDRREAADVSSLRVAIHAAAPCPVAVKQRMLDWWGPTLYEYYGGSEQIGMCAIGPDQWRSHVGSVGPAVLGTIHITDPAGRELPRGEEGLVWFEGASPFEYLGAPEKTASAHNDHGWQTLGDIGRLDDDGYLYLTDRRDNTIISGGVNIYPAEIEQVLASVPGVADVVVIGVPDADLGEAVTAVVEPGPGADDALVPQMRAACEAHLARFKHPRRYEVVERLPRLETGKIRRRDVQRRYAETR